jgi:hypothetical protein
MNFQGRKCKDYFWDFTDFYYVITPIVKMITLILE